MKTLKFKHSMNSAIVSAIFILVLMTTAFASDTVDRTQRPKGKPTPEIKLPNIQKTTLKNGLNVWLVEQHKLPVVAFNLVLQSGADQDPAGTPGIASLTGDLIDEGTKSMNSLEIAAKLEEIGVNFGVNASYDGTSITIGGLSKNLDKALAIYSDIICHPTFPEREVNRIRKQRMTQLKQQKDSPPAIANNVFGYLLYGSEHPYGNNPVGTEESLEKIKREDLIAYYDKHYRPNNGTLIVVGDVTMNDVKSRLETAFADWAPADVVNKPVPAPKLPDKMTVYLVDKPGAAQSEVRIGYPALARSTPDFFAVQLMNRMLGGQFTSRINLNIREKHGYTYGARSGFSFQKGAGPFSASGGIVTNKTDSSLIEFMKELNLMRDKGMTADELEYSKKGTQGNFLMSFETPGQIAGAMQNIVLYNLPEDYYQKYLLNIDAVKTDDANRVAAKYLDTSKMIVLVVGDLSVIKEGVEKLNLGKVVVCDVNGKAIDN